MGTKDLMTSHKKNPVRELFTNIFYKIKNRLANKNPWGMEIEEQINKEFPDSSEQDEAKELLRELLTRNNNLLDTLDIGFLDKKYVNLFGKANFERIIMNEYLQSEILGLSDSELQTYSYLLNYNAIDFNERISELSSSSLKFTIDELKSLPESERLKAVSICCSNSAFNSIISDGIDDLDTYYERRKQMCIQVINNPEVVDEELAKFEKSEDEYEVPKYPIQVLLDMEDLSKLDRIKYSIIEAKYGINLDKANNLCRAFGKDIDKIEQSESTRIIKELQEILQENDIDALRKINLDENYNNYTDMLNIVPTLRNAYLHEYQKTLYQLNENDFIGTQTLKTKGKTSEVKIYNALGKGNDRAQFNMILTSLGGVYPYYHNYDDFKSDWDRPDANHTISCSYIGNDFLGVVHENYLLAFSDVSDNELLDSSNSDCGHMDSVLDETIHFNSNFLTPKSEINTSKRYNELVLERKLEKDGKLLNRTPTFAVFMAESLDDINDDSNVRWKETKRMAVELGIPVVVIDVKQCMKLEFEKIEEMLKELKENKKMDLIPEIIHKIENNRGAGGENTFFESIRDDIFSKSKINGVLEQIMGTIINSDTETFNKGIEEFVKVTKELKNDYSATSDNKNAQYYKTYDYDEYLEKMKTLFITRNGLNEDGSPNVRNKAIEPIGLDNSPKEMVHRE